MQTLTTTAALTAAEKDAAIAGGVAGAMISTMAIFAFALYIITVIATWKIFKKAGEPGWKCLIPIYNIYIMYKIVNMRGWFWWMLAIVICASIMIAVDMPDLYNMTNQQMSMINWGQHPMTIIAIVVSIVAEFLTNIVFAWRTSKVFGHGVGYFIGLFFLQPIFWLILGFDRSKYNKKNLQK